MNNYEDTTQFKAKYKVWLTRQEGSEHTGFPMGPVRSGTAKVDPEGDTIMTPARTTPQAGARANSNGLRGKNVGPNDKSAPRAKWVTKVELNSRREKGLCFRCGASGHRVDSCPYRAAVNPAKATSVNISAASFPPILEETGLEPEESDIEEAGKA
jgi:hypothetical protein